MKNFAIEREQSKFIYFAEPTNEVRAEAKFTLIMPYKKEEDKVNREQNQDTKGGLMKNHFN